MYSIVLNSALLHLDPLRMKIEETNRGSKTLIHIWNLTKRNLKQGKEINNLSIPQLNMFSMYEISLPNISP